MKYQWIMRDGILGYKKRHNLIHNILVNSGMRL